MAMYEVSSSETHCMTVLDEGVEYVNNQDDMVLIYASVVNTMNFVTVKLLACVNSEPSVNVAYEINTLETWIVLKIPILYRPVHTAFRLQRLIC
jgi:hypothetical protein